MCTASEAGIKVSCRLSVRCERAALRAARLPVCQTVCLDGTDIDSCPSASASKKQQCKLWKKPDRVFLCLIKHKIKDEAELRFGVETKVV